MLRMEYLFLLAHVCHVTPEASWRLSLIDFARLLPGIDGWVEAQKQAVARAQALGEPG